MSTQPVSETRPLAEYDTVELVASIVGQSKGNFGTVTAVHPVEPVPIYEVEWVDRVRSLVAAGDLRFVPEEEF